MKLFNLFIFFIFQNIVYSQNPDEIERFFGNNVNGFNNQIHKIDVSGNGKIIVIGDFTLYNSLPINKIALFNSNGTIDTNFVSPFTSNQTIFDVSFDLNGNILVVTDYNLIRLNANGTIDNNFLDNTSCPITSVFVEDSGKIIIGGSDCNVTNRSLSLLSFIRRLNQDGSPDITFGSFGNGFIGIAGGFITKIKENSQGDIFVVNNSYPYLKKFYNNGVEDNVFFQNYSSQILSNQKILDIVVYPNSSSIISLEENINFPNLNNRIQRLNSDGTLFTPFWSIGYVGKFNSLELQQDFKFLAAINDIENNDFRILRFNENGIPDGSYNVLFDNKVNVLFKQVDNKLLVGGNFLACNNTQNSSYLVRLFGDNNLNNMTNIIENGITVSPNPASTQININFNNINDLNGGTIKIINSLGQQVATTPITVSGTNTSMQLATWGGAGMYFVQIINPQGQIVDIKKIILQ